jgi:hypothetical protein
MNGFARLALALALVVSGTVLAKAPPPQSAEQLASTHGYVFVSYPRGGTPDLLAVAPVQGGKKVKLQPRDDAGKSAFGLWLPPGQYRIAAWADTEFPDYVPFEVQAGRVTDLGSLVTFNVGGYGYVVLPVRHPEVAHDVDAAIAQYGSLLTSPEPLRWLPQAPPKALTLSTPATNLGLIADLLLAHERKVNKPSINKQLQAATTVEEFFRLGRSALPPLAEEFAQGPDGALYFGADLGQVRVRRPDGTWASLDTGTLRAVMSVEVKDDLLVAGTRGGELRGSRDGGQTWRVLRALSPDESIVDIDRADGRWLLTTLHRSAPFLQEVPPQGILMSVAQYIPDRVNVYTARQDDFSDLAPAGDFALDPKKLLSWLGPLPAATATHYYVGTYPELQRLDLASMAWQKITPPTEVSGFHVSPVSPTVVAFKAWGAFSKVFVSADGGDTWTKIDRPSYPIMDVVMDTPATGWATRINMGAFQSKVALAAFDGKLWADRIDAPPGCARVLFGADRTPTYCVTTAGSILARTGSQWDVEFGGD